MSALYLTKDDLDELLPSLSEKEKTLLNATVSGFTDLIIECIKRKKRYNKSDDSK